MDRIMATQRRRNWRNRPLAAIAALAAAGIAAAALAAPALAAEVGPSATAITCTNPASGARWQIRIDDKTGTVDANPARIGDREISWHDRTDGGNYTLDRKTGALTVVVASSTGGYFLHDHCSLGQSR
jgi:hypothetical protein